MKERPILFSGPMVRALLAGTKTQTRRALRVQPPVGTEWMNTYHHPKDAERPYWWAGAGGDLLDFSTPCPYGQPGDRLWVRETWQVARETIDYETGGEYDVFEWTEDLGDPRPYLNGDARFGTKAGLFYAADGEDKNPGAFYNLTGFDNKTVLRPKEINWRQSIHMPRWASRITLEVTGVRVERLQDISEKDAWAEGCEGYDDDVTGGKSGYSEFHDLWEQINGPESWAANPWVWCVSFRRLEAAC